MSSLSIRNMNFVLGSVELNSATVQPLNKADRSHYWHIERKTKRGNRWVFHSEFFGSKGEAADHWRRFFIGKKTFRLRHLLAY